MSSNNATISTFKEFMERYNDYDRAFKLTGGITKMFNREISFRPRSRVEPRRKRSYFAI